MAWYRAYFLNDKRSISDVEEFKSESDEQALARARVMLAARASFVAVEIWQEARPVSLYPQSVAA